MNSIYKPYVLGTRARLNEKNQRGVISLVMAFNALVLLGMAALAIDLGHGWVVKQELQNVADSAALAGARQVGLIYEGLDTAGAQQNYFLTSAAKQAIVNQINALTPNSNAGGAHITFSSSDIIVGNWDSTTGHLTSVDVDTPGSLPPTGVGIQVRRDETVNQPVETFFAGLLGVDGINIVMGATAALTTLSSAAPGGIGAPFAISEQWFENGNSCGAAIKFSPTGSTTGCAGWHTFTDPSHSANTLNNIVDGLNPLTEATFTAPEAVAGQTQFNFTGGELAGVFNNLEALYDANKDASSGEWKVLVPVYESTDCSNPSGFITIVGFVTATITSVLGPPDKLIEATVDCGTFELGRGGGTSGGGTVFTPVGTLPGLVS